METIEFEGWGDCLRLQNGAAELVITQAVGPRILRYGLLGGPNAFHVIPETKGRTGGDEWLPYGGHRLWHEPEVKPRTYQADNGRPESVRQDGRTVTITNAIEAQTGIQREIEVTLAASGPAAKVAHRLTNRGVWPVTLAPWALSIVANGGFVALPQEPFVSHDDDLLPARPVVLWKFTNMADPRWRWGRRYICLHQKGEEGDPQKVGVYSAQGWAAHVTPQQVFLTVIEPQPGGPANLPDQGCNFETYTDGPFQELETLAPLQTLEPGETATHVEYWFLKPGGVADNDEALDAALLPLVADAQATFRSL